MMCVEEGSGVTLSLTGASEMRYRNGPSFRSIINQGDLFDSYILTFCISLEFSYIH